MNRTSSTAEAEKKLRTFIAKFDPKNQSLIRAVRAALRRRFPAANELVYDNYNFFVIGYGPTQRPSECFVSIAAAAKGVSLCFLQGANLPDPEGILLGAGKQTRFVRVPSAAVLARSEVATLLSVAAARARLPDEGAGELIIRSVSAKQRPRRKA